MTATAANTATMARIIARARANDVRVQTVDGWRTRGRPYHFAPEGFVEHHDASSRSSGERGALPIIITGRDGIPGPLSQFLFPRCLDDIPTVIVVAAGLANHAGEGGAYYGIPADVGNTYLYGGEVANNGIDEPYSDALTYAITTVEAAVLEVLSAPTDRRLLGHKEWAPGRKTDPRLSMTARRTDVARVRMTMHSGTRTYEEPDMPLTNEDLDRIAARVVNADLTPGDTSTDVTVGRALAKLLDAATREAARDKALRTKLAELPDLLEARLDVGPAGGGLTIDDVRGAARAAVRDVLGSLDDPRPAP